MDSTRFADLQARIRGAASPDELRRIADELRERLLEPIATAAEPVKKKRDARRRRTG
jgi:hypothetical protein